MNYNDDILNLDDLPIAPGMSDKLKINQVVKNTTLNICTTKPTLQSELAEDVGGFWDDEVPVIENQPDIILEPISIDEIEHIKVIMIIV